MFAINEQFNYWIELKGKIYSHPDNDKRVKISQEQDKFFKKLYFDPTNHPAYGK